MHAISKTFYDDRLSGLKLDVPFKKYHALISERAAHSTMWKVAQYTIGLVPYILTLPFAALAMLAKQAFRVMSDATLKKCWNEPGNCGKVNCQDWKKPIAEKVINELASKLTFSAISKLDRTDAEPIKVGRVTTYEELPQAVKDKGELVDGQQDLEPVILDHSIHVRELERIEVPKSVSDGGDTMVIAYRIKQYFANHVDAVAYAKHGHRDKMRCVLMDTDFFQQIRGIKIEGAEEVKDIKISFYRGDQNMWVKMPNKPAFTTIREPTRERPLDRRWFNPWNG